MMENRFWGWVVVVGSQVQVCEDCESGRVVGITTNDLGLEKYKQKKCACRPDIKSEKYLGTLYQLISRVKMKSTCLSLEQYRRL